MSAANLGVQHNNARCGNAKQSDYREHLSIHVRPFRLGSKTNKRNQAEASAMEAIID